MHCGALGMLTGSQSRQTEIHWTQLIIDAVNTDKGHVARVSDAIRIGDGLPDLRGIDVGEFGHSHRCRVPNLNRGCSLHCHGLWRADCRRAAYAYSVHERARQITGAQSVGQCTSRYFVGRQRCGGQCDGAQFIILARKVRHRHGTRVRQAISVLNRLADVASVGARRFARR